MDSKQIMLKNQCSKIENVTLGGGGVQKVPKKCHVLFEWSLMQISFSEYFMLAALLGVCKTANYQWEDCIAKEKSELTKHQ
jgi:hypothetical protein